MAHNYQQAEHDEATSSKKVTIVGGSISSGGQATVTPLQAWPDPKTYIGLVTITGSLAPATGNITLDPGSKTQITGNLTLSDAKTYIGLVTATAVQGTSPWVSSIIGNLTLSDPKGFIGLVTAVGLGGTQYTDGDTDATVTGTAMMFRQSGGNGVLAVADNAPLPTVDADAQVTLDAIESDTTAIAGDTSGIATDASTIAGAVAGTEMQVDVVAALPTGPNFIGIVTVTNKDRTITGNLTLTDSKSFIGLTTTVVGTALPAGANFIGLVTVVGSLSPAAGNVTLDPGSRTGIVGNVTLSDSKTYVGLVTATLGASTAAIGKLAANSGVDIGDVDVTSLPALPAGVNSIGFATVTPVMAWPDPKTYIGLVTITGALSAAAGNITLDAGSRVGIVGNVTLSDAKTFIGLVTVGGGVLNTITAVTDITNPIALKGNLTLSDSKTFIGLTTTTIGAAIPAGANFIGLVTVVGSLSPAAGNVTLDAGSRAGIVGNLTLSDAKTFIGLTTSTLGASPAFIGIVTVANASFPVTQSGGWGVDIAGGIIDSAHITGNVTLTDAKTFIGLTTTTLGASPAFVGIVTIANSNIRAIAGNLTLSDAKTFIGLVTANAVNVGTNKTLIHKTIAFSQASIVTIAVPSNTFKITQLLINSNATTRLNIKSGATYLTGNVSLGMCISPGGGWVENGSPDSPVYIGLAGAAAIVLEKLDLTGTSAQIAGKLIYFDE